MLEGQREIVKVVKRVIWQNRDNLNSGLLPGNNMLAVAAFEQIWKEAKGSVLAFCQEKDVYTTHPWDLLNCRAVVFAFDFMRDDCTRKLKKIICGLRFAVLTSVTIEVTQQTIARINQGASVERSLRLVPEQILRENRSSWLNAILPLLKYVSEDILQDLGCVYISENTLHATKGRVVIPKYWYTKVWRDGGSNLIEMLHYRRDPFQFVNAFQKGWFVHTTVKPEVQFQLCDAHRSNLRGQTDWSQLPGQNRRLWIRIIMIMIMLLMLVITWV